MSSSVFKPCMGAAEIKRDCEDSSFLQIDAAGLSQQAIVSGLTLEMSGNYQFLHTLNELVYFYAFGDRVGTLNITGIGFIVPCSGSKGSLMKVYNYYVKNRAAKSGNKAMSIVLTAKGEQIQLWGFLTGMRIDVTDSQMGTVGYWSLRFEVLPKSQGGGGGGGGGFPYAFGPGMASSGAGAINLP